MRLSLKNIEDKAFWEEKQISLPDYDIESMRKMTKAQPRWIHVGGGNIFRAFIARKQEELLNQGLSQQGIVVVETFDEEVIEKVYKPYDDLSLVVLMNAEGKFEKQVVASVAESMSYNEKTLELLKVYTAKDSLEMISFTITEKGYRVKDGQGNWIQSIQEDIEKGPKSPRHTMSLMTALLYNRYRHGQAPITMVSMDNCSHNGDLLQTSILDIARAWMDQGFVDSGFLIYLKDRNSVGFPLTMIDKITPRPSETVKEHLEKLGVEGMECVLTTKKSYMAPFVNAEMPEYLVIEDWFTNGRMPLEKSGVIFTERETVNKVETMKVTTCLNPLHTALAVTGCLLGYKSIAEEMKDPILKKMVEKIGYEEGLPVVVDPKIINPREFLDEVINERLPNPFIPDAPQRIATDTSQKVGIRYGHTIKAYMDAPDKNPEDLEGIPLAIAAWCRYLLGTNDQGEDFELSPDPLAKDLVKRLKGLHVGNKTSSIACILSDVSIFGMNLYESGVTNKIEIYFNKMLQGNGMVRKTLEEVLGDE